MTTTPSRGVRLAGALGLQDVGRALRDFATYLPSQLLPAIAGFLVLPILARELAPTELGVLALCQTVITLGWIAAGQWLTSAVMRELPAARAEGTIGRFSSTLARGFGVAGVMFAAFSVLLTLAATLSGAVSDNLVLLLAASAGLIIQNIAVTLYAAELRPRGFAVVEVLARVGGIALGVYLVFQGEQVHGYLLGLSAGSLVVGGVGLLAAWPRAAAPTRGARWRDVRPWLDYGLPIGVSAVALWALFYVDRYLLAWLENTGAVGIYSVGAVIGDKIIAIPTFAFFVAARPLLFRAMEQDGRAEVERLMRAYTRVVLLIGMPIIAAATVTAPAIVMKLAGGLYYSTAAGVIPFVAVGSLIWALALFGTSGLTTARRSRPFIYAALIALAANVIANLFLIPRYGIKGAAIATPIGNGVYLVAAQYWARRYASWRFPWPTFVRTTLAAGAGYAAAVAARTLSGSPLGSFSGAGFTCLIVYVVVLLMLGERRAFANRSASA